MPQSSSSGPEAGQASSPLSGKDLTSLQSSKLDLAQRAAMVQDSREVLQMTAESNRITRDQTHRLREAQLQKTLADLGGPQAAAPSEDGDVGDINIDSPVTVHHHYPPASQPPALPGQPPPAPAPAGWEWCITEMHYPDGLVQELSRFLRRS